MRKRRPLGRKPSYKPPREKHPVPYKNIELANKLRDEMRVHARKKPFLAAVVQGLSSYKINVLYKKRAFTLEVFELVKQLPQEDPAVFYMDLHHKFLTQGRDLGVKYWKNISTGELAGSIDKPFAEEPINAVFSEFSARLTEALKVLEDRGIVRGFVERLPGNAFVLIRETK